MAYPSTCAGVTGGHALGGLIKVGETVTPYTTGATSSIPGTAPHHEVVAVNHPGKTATTHVDLNIPTK